jgi:hypothetical protein
MRIRTRIQQLKLMRIRIRIRNPGSDPVGGVKVTGDQFFSGISDTGKQLLAPRVRKQARDLKLRISPRFIQNLRKKRHSAPEGNLIHEKPEVPTSYRKTSRG